MLLTFFFVLPGRSGRSAFPLVGFPLSRSRAGRRSGIRGPMDPILTVSPPQPTATRRLSAFRWGARFASNVDLMRRRLVLESFWDILRTLPCIKVLIRYFVRIQRTVCAISRVPRPQRVYPYRLARPGPPFPFFNSHCRLTGSLANHANEPMLGNEIISLYLSLRLSGSSA
ncbi:hypothetical protein SODALDRAFT_12887 [Sodiomyces alkalinus F11]|uniref:Uncharacterized protein n=1 Tax=Sodiomyces alkalinus (strain CBS 110278 / VKM F-3762 / F11) TaxID=1314773 RepID=A0A3N2Q6C1_SODAK|nr:hypothetical protein SODALDRAFT_12887 [Sodiomyces alkalinus F11]ROT42333.1 hypothetical protein SODALDRAFT_12887 [Sodiomyces alkalinus F11]